MRARVQVDIWQYSLQREAEFKTLGCVPDRPWSEVFTVEESDERRARVLTNVGLTDNAYLRVYERIVMRAGRPTREAYGYCLVIEEQHVCSWERDPQHPDSPVHEHHGENRARVRGTRPIPFKRAVELAWEEVSRQAEASAVDAAPVATQR